MFEWDEANVDHIARHGITPEEIEEAFQDPHRVAGAAYRAGGERRRAFIGRTESGRLLFVVYTAGRHLRVITAYDAEPEDRRRYRRQNR